MHLSKLHWLALLLCGCGAAVSDSEPEALTSVRQGVIPVESFRDSFNGANNANYTGLNDNLWARQSGTLAPATYTRVSGLWYSAPPPNIWWAQVNQIWSPDTLTFHESPSALRMDKPFSRDASGAFRLSFVVEPVISDARDSYNWASVMLSSSSASNAFVSNADIDFGFLIRSNGGLSIFDNGTQVEVTPASVPAADRYVVSLAVRDGHVPGTTEVLGTINGISFFATLNGPTPLPGQAYLYLGAYLDAGQVTRFDDVAVFPVVDHLKHYGYFWAQSELGAHLDEVTAYTNLNFVQRPQDLAVCAARGVKCILETRWQFFTDHTLLPNYAQNWNALVTAITPYLSSVGGFYLIDEPYWNNGLPGVSYNDLKTCVDTIKGTFPSIPVMVVHAVPSITPSLVTPPGVDWVGFDHTGPMSQVVSYLNTLRSTLTPNQKLWLVPMARRVGAYTTDADVARANWQYYDLARTDPRIVGLLNFGLWIDESPYAIPQTMAAEQAIGNELLRR